MNVISGRLKGTAKIPSSKTY